MKAWIDDLLDALGAQPAWAYHSGGSPSSEPTALVALALLAHARGAEPALRWLAARQSPDGTVGISAAENSPAWPTGLALLAWRAAGAQDALLASALKGNVAKAAAAVLKAKGRPMPRSDQLGHDTTLVGWPWVEGTHSWIEPTAWNVLALKACGHANHERTRQAVRLLIDRLLPEGGCNYGNTLVLGQALRAHVQPTGLALLALAGETDASGRLAASVRYLQGELSTDTAAASLGYGLLGLAAHGVVPAESPEWLEGAYRRAVDAPPAAMRLALLALAAAGVECPLIRLPQKATSP